MTTSPRTSWAWAATEALARTARAGMALSFEPDELYRVPTDDGASIALGRYRPRERRRFAEPVILCHGLGANRFNLDFDERHSLARYLARAGHEAWILELRGRGLAGPPIDSSFDDQARYDVGAALRTVLSTGAKSVSWVGHSKGGLLLFAHVVRNPDAPVKAAVALGSPVTFAVQPGLRHFLRAIDPLLKLPHIPASRLAALSLIGAPPSRLSRYMISHENMDPLMMKRSLANLASDIPGGVGRQFARWIRTGRFDGNDGLDYRAGLDAVRFPVLLLAGAHDLLAPPLAVARAQEHLGGPVKLTIAGQAHGFSDDYGHGDLILGRSAPSEVFPVVRSFLEQSATALIPV